jgi:DNA polymerase eta
VFRSSLLLRLSDISDNPFGDLKSLGSNDNRIVQSGSLIAVSYEARAAGVKRNMRGSDAKKVFVTSICELTEISFLSSIILDRCQICPQIILIQVPTTHGKADLTIYRDASAEIVNVLLTSIFTKHCIVERASIDEVYIDLSQQAEQMLTDQVCDKNAFRGLIDSLYSDSHVRMGGENRREMLMSKSELRAGYKTIDIGDDGMEAVDGAPADSGKVSSNRNAQLYAWLQRPLMQWDMDERVLICGAVIGMRLRKEIFDRLGFTCSAGVAHNKMLAKIGSAMEKPNKLVVLPRCIAPALMRTMEFSRVPGD